MTAEPGVVLRPQGAVGVRQPLVDGVEKVTGARAIPPTSRRATRSSAQSCAARWPMADHSQVDVSRARALPGVRAVITGDDCDMAYGVIPDRAERVSLWRASGCAIAASRSPRSPPTMPPSRAPRWTRSCSTSSRCPATSTPTPRAQAMPCRSIRTSPAISSAKSTTCSATSMARWRRRPRARGAATATPKCTRR